MDLTDILRRRVKPSKTTSEDELSSNAALSSSDFEGSGASLGASTEEDMDEANDEVDDDDDGISISASVRPNLYGTPAQD